MGGRGGLLRIGRAPALAALLSQAIVAGSSLVLLIIASRQLGSEGLGRFSLMLGILITCNAVQSGWIGDSLTVLDRFDPPIRSGLVVSQIVALVAMAALCGGGALLIDGVSVPVAIGFGAVGVTWAIEETGRRLLIARRQFWALVLNDAAYALGAVGTVVIALSLGHSASLGLLVASMAIGTLCAMSLAIVQLPQAELSRLGTRAASVGSVTSFGFWRAAQVGLRPGSQALVRTIVVVFASVAALGQLEAARLMLAPLLTVASGAGVYLLPTYASAVKEQRAFRPAVKPAMGLLAGSCLLYGALAIAAADVLGPLLTDGEYTLSPWAIAAWAIYVSGFAAGIPVGNAIVAHGASHVAFRLRLVDAVIGVAGASLLAAMTWVDAVPLGLAVGTVVGALLLLHALARLPKYGGETVRA